jgi:pyrimidine-nucleoside phosphorylase
MAALAMAIFFNGMSSDETAWLTDEMLNSGIKLAWPDLDGAVVDKHSTGGIGDKVSLILAPLLACCGFYVPMISGRGLGPTGGTLDKLESIAGFRTDLTPAELQRITTEVGCAIAAASAELAPADKKLYALRDVTGTVRSIPLITASIMSKKLAEGISSLVLDVKCGSGAFMKSLDEAQQLATMLVATGKNMGQNVSALITDMSQPLGRMAGNACEVNEAIEVMQGNGPDDVRAITLALAGELLRLEGKAATRAQGEQIAATHLTSGATLEKFRAMVTAQGGDLDATRELAKTSTIEAKQAGFVTQMDTEKLGMAVIELGGGRKVQGDSIDHSVGLELLVRIGDQVKVGQPVARIFAHESERDAATVMVVDAITIGSSAVQPPKLIVDSIGG